MRSHPSMPTAPAAKSFQLKRMRRPGCDQTRRREASRRGYGRNLAYWRAFRLQRFPHNLLRVACKVAPRRGVVCERHQDREATWPSKGRAFLYRARRHDLPGAAAADDVAAAAGLAVAVGARLRAVLAGRGVQLERHRLHGAGDRAAQDAEAGAGAGAGRRPPTRWRPTRRGRRASRRRGRR